MYIPRAEVQDIWEVVYLMFSDLFHHVCVLSFFLFVKGGVAEYRLLNCEEVVSFLFLPECWWLE